MHLQNTENHFKEQCKCEHNHASLLAMEKGKNRNKGEYCGGKKAHEIEGSETKPQERGMKKGTLLTSRDTKARQDDDDIHVLEM